MADYSCLAISVHKESESTQRRKVREEIYFKNNRSALRSLRLCGEKTVSVQKPIIYFALIHLL
jgi:hypothetical protein